MVYNFADSILYLITITYYISMIYFNYLSHKPMLTIVRKTKTKPGLSIVNFGGTTTITNVRFIPMAGRSFNINLINLGEYFGVNSILGSPYIKFTFGDNIVLAKTYSRNVVSLTPGVFTESQRIDFINKTNNLTIEVTYKFFMFNFVHRETLGYIY